MTPRIALRLGTVVLAAVFAADAAYAQQVVGPAVDPSAFGLSTALQAQQKRGTESKS